MKNTHLLLFTTLLCSVLSACNDHDKTEITSPIAIDFSKEHHDFEAFFSDYPVGEEEFFQLVAEYKPLPTEFGEKKGWYLAGNNHSDDLIMAIKGSINGLQSNTLYSADIEIEFLTNTPSNCVGIGGAPGESVYVKLATSKDEPVNYIEDKMYRITTDIGFQAQSGSEGVVVGNIASGIDCDDVVDFSYHLKKMSTEHPVDVMSDENGRIWLLAATDSGFEGFSSIYITKLTATISD